MRQGVTAHEFARIAEAAFVAAAEDVLREQSRRPTHSRISLLTGLHRHAVSATQSAIQTEQLDSLAQKDYQRNRLARVLTGWHEHPDFTDPEGRPRRLTLQGPEPSFSDLVRRFSGDLYPGLVLEELQRAGAVRSVADGMLMAVARRIVPTETDPASFDRLGEVASDVLGTLEHNLASREQDKLFEDSAVSLRLPASAVPRLRRLVARGASPLLSDIDAWLEKEESRDAGTPVPRVRAGIYVVMVASPASEPDRAADEDSTRS